MKLNIKLGEKPGLSMPIGPNEKEQEVYYPEFNFREDSKPEFPEEGVMEIRYRKVRSSYDKKSKKPYSCTIEVMEIIEAEGDEEDEAPTKKDTSAEDALDALAREKMKGKKNEEDGEGY